MKIPYINIYTLGIVVSVIISNITTKLFKLDREGK